MGTKIGEISKETQTILMMTWGYRDGDDTNPYYYPTYSEMQSRIRKGYNRYRNAIWSANGGGGDRPPAKIAPVGLAFERIYAEGTTADVFNGLYKDDGKHPSVSGTYLAALVLYATITGNDPTKISYAPPSIGADLKNVLRDAA